MAVFASLRRWYKAVAFQRGGNWPRIGIPHSLEKLSNACCFARDPAGRTRRHMTFHTLDSGVRRIGVSCELGTHAMARLSAKLRCLHMLDRSISELCPDKHIENGGDPQKPSYATQCCLPIEDSFNVCLKATLSKVNADGNEC